jgi:CPA1 family monovalent cation:H+ antiporter
MNDLVASIAGLAGLLALISMMPPLAGRLRIPYSVLLALVGVALGVVSHFAPLVAPDNVLVSTMVSWNQSANASEVFLYIFLPILLFESSIGIDAGRLLDDIGPILVLAIVAVLVSTLMVGFTLSAASGMALAGCLLLAAAVSTTDPSAVIAIFRDLGAPRRLTLLVEGEAVFNDAAAIAIFSLLLPVLMQGGTFDLGHGLFVFVTGFIGGVAIGHIAAHVLCWILPRFGDDRMSELTLTLAATYLTYIVTDHVFHYSGVVATVTLALSFGALGRTRVAPDNWTHLRASWEVLGFWANSLIFVLAAMLVPRTLAAANAEEAWLLGVLVVAALAARAATLFGILPLLSLLNLSARVSNANKLVIVWGGLRGAVTLALALAVTENTALDPELRRFVGVLATGFVLFTLFVNALTLRPLMRLLGLDRMSRADIAMRDRVLELGLAQVREEAALIARDYRLDEEAAAFVDDYYQHRLGQLGADAQAARLSDDERLYVGLATLANREQELYLEQFAAQLTSRWLIGILTNKAGQLKDGVKARGVAGYDEAVARGARWSPRLRAALWIQRHLGWTRPLEVILGGRLELLLVTSAVLRELVSFNRRKLTPLLGERVGEQIAARLSARIETTESALHALKLQYPDYAYQVQSRYLGRAALRLERAEYRLLLARRRGVLLAAPRLDLGLSRDQLISSVPIFERLGADQHARLAALLRPILFMPGEKIIEKGSRGDGMYFIASGAVEVRVAPAPVRLGTGAFFGEMALLYDRPRNADVVALGYCQILELPGRDFHRLLEADASIRDEITRAAEARAHPQAVAPAAAGGAQAKA